MIRLVLAGLVVLAVVIAGFSAIGGGDAPVESGAVLLRGESDISGFARAFAPRQWDFPRDFGAHPEYQTEWWYYTGNLQTDDGRHFGYQFTIFRRAISAQNADSASEWRTNQVYMAHFGVSDIAGGRYLHESRLVRGGAGLAGAETEPTLRVWLEGWQIAGLDPAVTARRITADAGDFAIDLTMQQIKPPALQGDRGLSAKSAEPGNASHYYTLSRMPTEGTIRIGGETFTVRGNTWKDHEFSTSALGGDAYGWDWFGLQFDDGRELMIGQIRLRDGGRDPYFGGLLIDADGGTTYLPSDSFTITATGSWASPYTGAVYPAGWTVTVTPPGSEAFTFRADPMMADQELHSSGIAYWEGAVRLSGDVTGFGYAELTGYADSLNGRF